MNRLNGRTVLITGATAGIGEACARAFASAGSRLVLCGRRADRLADVTEALVKEHGTEVRVRALDVTDREGIDAWVEDLQDDDFMPDVIVNNAGKGLGLSTVHEGSLDDWDEMIDTNVKGVLYVTRAFLPHMVAAGRGHVVNVGSVAGRWVYPRGAVYCSTKFAVKALTEGMNVDLAGTAVKVSSVDPGMTETEFSEVRFQGDTERAASVYRGVEPLTGDDIAEVVCWVVNAPPHVNIFQTLVMPTAQRNPYVLHREGA